MRTLLLIPAVALLVAGAACSSDDGGGEAAASTTTAAVTETTLVGGDFCVSAVAFATAQLGAPDAVDPADVEATVTAMAAAADQVAATAPDEADVQTFADAIAGLEQYAAARDFAVDLGSAAPEYQSGEGAAVVAAITDSIGPVDQAVQDECGHFLTEVP